MLRRTSVSLTEGNNMESSRGVSERIYHVLVKGRRSDKEALSSELAGLDETELVRLRRRILAALEDEYHPGHQYTDEDRNEAANTRSWLLNILARIAGTDNDAGRALRAHLDPQEEPSEWTRYWALEGLVAAGVADLETLARQSLETDLADLVKRLALAILASKGDPKALQEITGKVSEWATMRALRVVPIGGTVTGLCEIVERAAYEDATYEAIVALGQTPPTSSRADRAARSLGLFVATVRPYPRFDEMRARALVSLGNLQVESSTPVLIEELTDEHPAIVREAARAMVKVLGERTAAARVVETALKAGRDRVAAYAAALRWMHTPSVVDEIEAAMVSGPAEHQISARTLLSEIGGAAAMQKLMARTRSTDQYTAALQQAETRISELFETSIRDARKGFLLASIMDAIVFAIGVLLIGGSGLAILVRGQALDSWAGVGLTGGTGVLGVIYGILIARPRKQVREAVDHLMYLKIVFLGYLRQLHQTDQAYTRRLLEDEPMLPEEVGKFSLMVGETMAQAVQHLTRPLDHSATGPA